MALSSRRLFVIGEWADVDEPTGAERIAFYGGVGYLTARRGAEIAAWLDQVVCSVTADDRRFLRFEGLGPWDK